MDEIVTERLESILRVQLNRPTKRNAMTSAMYLSLADIFDKTASDESTRVVLWHGAGDLFCAGNDIEDFLKNPPSPGNFPQAKLMEALVNFDKPVVAAVHGAAIGGGTTMLTHCDFVYAGESTKFQMPFINLALVPEFGSSYSLPARVGHVRAAEPILLGTPFDARRAAELNLVTAVVSDKDVLATATDAVGLPSNTRLHDFAIYVDESVYHASDIPPPDVFVGSRPFGHSSPPSSVNGPPSPRAQKP